MTQIAFSQRMYKKEGRKAHLISNNATEALEPVSNRPSPLNKWIKTQAQSSL